MLDSALLWCAALLAPSDIEEQDEEMEEREKETVSVSSEMSPEPGLPAQV